MRKMFFVLVALSLIAAGFFANTLISNARALTKTIGLSPFTLDELYQSNDQLIKENSTLREELDAYKTLEAYWATEVITFANSLQGQWIREIHNRKPGSFGGREEGM